MRWVTFQLIVGENVQHVINLDIGQTLVHSQDRKKRRIAKAEKRKFKAVIKQRNIRNRAAETNFNLELPDGYDDSEDNHWTASLNDSRETVVEFPGEDNHWTASNRFEPVEVSQEDRDEEEHTSGSVKRLKEFVNSISDLEIKTAIDMIKNAKETDNHAQGLTSKNTDFRSANVETFLFDTGASISLMGEQIARENNLTINWLAGIWCEA